MSDITVIIPLHIFDDDNVKPLLQRSIESVDKNVNIIVSTISSIKEPISEFVSTYLNVSVVKNDSDNKSDFCSLVNYAVSNHIKTDWFSILEYDDFYMPYWFNVAKKYIYSNKDAKIYLSLVDLYDFERYENKQPRSYCGYANEAAWASSFSDDLGYIDNECLQNYFNFNMTGGVFHTDTFKEIGMLKPNIFMAFWYEFLLRATIKKHKIYVIPKIGYNHFIDRKDSLSKQIASTIQTQEEGDYWLKVAKQECYYTEHRAVEPYQNKTDEKENANN